MSTGHDDARARGGENRGALTHHRTLRSRFGVDVDRIALLHTFELHDPLAHRALILGPGLLTYYVRALELVYELESELVLGLLTCF